MAWSSTGYVITAARAAQWTTACFAVGSAMHTECVIAGAQQAGVPLIVQVAAESVDGGGAAGEVIPWWARQCHELAAAASVPVALHLAAQPSRGLMRRAAEAGFSSIGLRSRDELAEREHAAIRRAAWWAHEHGLLMEGRFGQVGGSDGAKLGEYGRHTRMDPARAACFAASTEVDLLSFSAQPPRYTAPAHAAGLDFDAIAQLCDALPVPLALHDIAGVPEDQLSKGIRLGIVKLEVVPGAGSPYAHAVRTLLRGERRGASVEPERAALTVAVAQLLAVMS